MTLTPQIKLKLLGPIHSGPACSEIIEYVMWSTEFDFSRALAKAALNDSIGCFTSTTGTQHAPIIELQGGFRHGQH